MAVAGQWKGCPTVVTHRPALVAGAERKTAWCQPRPRQSPPSQTATVRLVGMKGLLAALPLLRRTALVRHLAVAVEPLALAACNQKCAYVPEDEVSQDDPSSTRYTSGCVVEGPLRAAAAVAGVVAAMVVQPPPLPWSRPPPLARALRRWR